MIGLTHFTFKITMKRQYTSVVKGRLESFDAVGRSFVRPILVSEIVDLICQLVLLLDFPLELDRPHEAMLRQWCLYSLRIIGEFPSPSSVL